MQKHIIAAVLVKINRKMRKILKNCISRFCGPKTRGVEVDFRMNWNQIRTDLALEAKELWEQDPSHTTELRGVLARETKQKGVSVNTVQILDEEGEQQLGKPVGTYVTLDLVDYGKKERDSLRRAAQVLAGQLRSLLPLKKGQSVLVAGLGNEAVTPDAIGPRVVRQLVVTRHLVERMPTLFGAYRPVSAIAPNVLGLTGLESAEVVGGVVDRAGPDCMIVVDALAASDLRRVCRTVQLADTGITPGSGVQNGRAAFNQDRFGIPVIAVGVPTVAHVPTVAQLYDETLDQAGVDELTGGQSMVITPQDMDAQVERLSKLVAWGINLALQESMDLEDIAFFVE